MSRNRSAPEFVSFMLGGRLQHTMYLLTSRLSDFFYVLSYSLSLFLFVWLSLSVFDFVSVYISISIPHSLFVSLYPMPYSAISLIYLFRLVGRSHTLVHCKIWRPWCVCGCSPGPGCGCESRPRSKWYDHGTGTIYANGVIGWPLRPLQESLASIFTVYCWWEGVPLYQYYI